MKKLLYIPLTYQSKEGAQEDDLFRAFQKEFDVHLPGRGEINFDIIHTHAGAISRNGLKLLKAASKPGCKISQWTGDASYSCLRSVMISKDVCDLTLLSTGIGQQEMYSKFLGHRVEWMPEAVADHQIPPPKELMDGKIVFTGNHYDCFPGGEERLELFRLLSMRFPDRFEVYGSFNFEGVNCKGPIDWEKVPQLYNDAYIVIAMDNYFDIEGYFTHRHLGAAGTSCCVARKFKGMESKNWDYCVWFNNKYEAHDQIQFLLENPEVRNEIAKKGHQAVKDNYTYDSWVKRYKQLIESL